ncbi:tumor necrosis factor ligand superfamily member 11 isoform X1 [Chiloscyllium plagiosum]|uniref:tumor necrosis factor ligand superfamily member 11 isoform X1 n=1 Tax=Chiloscyllium plagiosum TaxID=36176 RepID=UPI001CB7FF7C|nr:tumor necrosis factor ligand superfamily member 11 isoform X1 [Chiloscyllium plagiosum]
MSKAEVPSDGCLSPGARSLLAPFLCVSVLQLALSIGFIWYCQYQQGLQKDVRETSEEFLHLLSLLSSFNRSIPELSDMRIQKCSPPCLLPLKHQKQPVNKVDPGAADKKQHRGLAPNRTRKNMRKLTPYAHLTMKKPIKAPSDLETRLPGLKGKLITSWEERVGVAHLRELRYSNGALEIKHQGLYYIYSQILFRYHADYPMSTREYQLVQYIYRKMANYPKPTLLLRGASTWCSGNHNLYSVYQGGVFDLRSGDKLFVTVSNLTLVDADEASSYLGAFKLD